MNRNVFVATVFVSCVIAPGLAIGEEPKKEETTKKEETKKDPPKPECTFTLDIETAGQWITILPDRQPPTRSRLSFDSASGNIDIEWDPYDGRGLLRRVVLPKDKWHVSFWSEPQRDSMRFDRNYAWQPIPQTACPTGTFKDGSKGTFLLTELGLATQSSTVKIELTGVEKRTLTGQTASRLTDSTSASGQLMRSFDVADLPAKLAEVAIKVVVQRVERKALRVATKRLRDVLCQQKNNKTVLPATCAIVDALDLRTLPSIANHFAAALASDLFALAQAEIVVDEATKEVVGKVFKTAVQVSQLLQRVKEMSADELQARFLAMAEATFEVTANPTNGVCAAQLALTLIAYCESSSQCNASFLHDVIQNPSTYFSLGKCDEKFAEAAEAKQRIEAIIADGRSVFRAAQSLTTLDRAAAALRANLRVIEVIVCSDEAAAACEAAKQLTVVGIALSAGDLSAIGSAAEKLIMKHAPQWSPRQRKMVSLFLNFMSDGLPIVSTNEEEAKLAQGRLEKAFDLFLDGAADRDGRDGENIASLAASLRVTGGVDFGGEFRGPLSLPVGMGFDFTFENKAENEGKTKGFHLELNAVDLGNYIQFDNDAELAEPKWADLACLSAGVGVFWGDHDAPFSLTFTGGAAPGTTTNEMGVAERGWTGFVAINFGVYVPLIDLN